MSNGTANASLIQSRSAIVQRSTAQLSRQVRGRTYAFMYFCPDLPFPVNPVDPVKKNLNDESFEGQFLIHHTIIETPDSVE